MDIGHLFSSNASWSVNKKLAKLVGNNTAILLSELLSIRSARADENGKFYCSVDEICEAANMGKDAQSACVEKLISLGMVEMGRDGMPARRYLKIVDSAVISQLSGNPPTSCREILQQVVGKSSNSEENFCANKEYIYNNNIYNTSRDINTSRNISKDLSNSRDINPIGNINIIHRDISRREIYETDNFFEEAFELFWSIYPKNTQKTKDKAKKVFATITDTEDVKAVIAACREYAAQCSERGLLPYMGKNADNWLRAEIVKLRDTKISTADINPDGFLEFWNAYPKKESMGEARTAYRLAIGIAAKDEILEGARRYAAAKFDIDRRYLKTPATWLAAECWNDEYDITADEGGDITADELYDIFEMEKSNAEIITRDLARYGMTKEKVFSGRSPYWLDS